MQPFFFSGNLSLTWYYLFSRTVLRIGDTTYQELSEVTGIIGA